jgi:hypothetical protein
MSDLYGKRYSFPMLVFGALFVVLNFTKPTDVKG